MVDMWCLSSTPEVEREGLATICSRDNRDWVFEFDSKQKLNKNLIKFKIKNKKENEHKNAEFKIKGNLKLTLKKKEWK